jgi:AraC-like DNA-binding protein
MKILFCFKSTLAEGSYVGLHMHTALELVYCMHGNATSNIDETTYHMQSGLFTIVPSGVYHDQTNTVETTTLCIGITDIDSRNMQGGWTDPDNRIGRACESLLTELTLKKIEYKLICEGLLNEIVGLIKRISSSETILTEKDQLVKKALGIINHQEGRITVGELADQMYVSKDYLRHLFLDRSPLSPLRYIISAKIEKAKTLLATSNLTISQISVESGFESVYYFSRIFKRVTGYSPSEFKTHITGKDKN